MAEWQLEYHLAALVDGGVEILPRRWMARRRLCGAAGKQVRSQERTGTCFIELLRFNMAHRINAFLRRPVAYRHRRCVAVIHVAEAVPDDRVIGATIGA